MTLFSFLGNGQNVRPNESLFKLKINDINGKELKLEEYKGKKILFVNVASKCGFTNQYDGLQDLYSKYQGKLVVIGLPCNQFGAQEPGTEQEIQSFCRMNYGVDFPMTEKIDVKGENQHPIYQWLTQKQKNGKMNSSVKWNFQKYLVDEEGRLIDVFYSITKPMSKKITKLL
ncbi:glutathione peroxidase [Tenacibaculum holothuriorum]|uniref:Glutathione peroxidase n=1 Tax=Tenacibaculum holothuriorum TaxID=1635173 RepID=A0A1Y2PC83_9FLAO|nr:glutathione peroxidase [Tenacibaculum holothuriorum]OSY87790.1 glutathione peroxidase [Tenacibaculum holothuriorum]